MQFPGTSWAAFAKHVQISTSGGVSVLAVVTVTYDMYITLVLVGPQK